MTATYTRKYCPECGWPADGQSCEHCGTNLVVQLGNVDRGHTVIKPDTELRRKIITFILAILSTLALAFLVVTGITSGLIVGILFAVALVAWVYFFALITTVTM